MNLQRIEETLNELNKFGFTDKGMNRLAYTDEEMKARKWFAELCRKEGMNVDIDECGNVIARREGVDTGLAPVAIGSHLDTVYDGGQYDGAVGVVLGLELVRTLNEKGIRTERPIEVIGFASEESSRFGVATIGSKAMAGELDMEKLRRLLDRNGSTFPEALQTAGLDFESLPLASRQNEPPHAFFEVHIEQGPVLENKRKDVGIVSAIAAPTRLHIVIEGKASHSGTTPLAYRKDALLGASEVALIVEQAAKEEAVNGTVATVGECLISPGAMNVVPGHAEMKVDIRGTSVASKKKVFQKLLGCFEHLQQDRHLLIEYEILSDEIPVQLNTEVIRSLESICRKEGLSYEEMVSGAGHDAMNMAKLCPTGLIFIPCRDGLSHHKDEFTSIEEISAGARLLEKAILKWANDTEQPASPHSLMEDWGFAK